jgi:hypothetical protein
VPSGFIVKMSLMAFVSSRSGSVRFASKASLAPLASRDRPAAVSRSARQLHLVGEILIGEPKFAEVATWYSKIVHPADAPHTGCPLYWGLGGPSFSPFSPTVLPFLCARSHPRFRTRERSALSGGFLASSSPGWQSGTQTDFAHTAF